MLKASLPNDWSYELAEEVVRDYVQRNFVDKGMCADWAIHDSENDKGQRNLHIHVLLTMRPIMENGEWGKRFLTLMKTGKEYPLSTKRQDSRKLTNGTENSGNATPRTAPTGTVKKSPKCGERI